MAYTTINKPSDYFNTVLYTGNGTSQSITGVNFQPDLVYLKDRTTAGNYPIIFDSVRGATKILWTPLTNGEATFAQTLTSFDSDGFSIGNSGDANQNTDNFVSWNWLGGGTGVSNTDGSITSTVSANTTSGFSIVQYTGTGANATVGHGLGVTPAMFIVKVTSQDGNHFMTWNKNFSNATDDFVRLNTTAAVATVSNFWGTSAPNSTTFSIGAGGYDNNVSGATHIAYCFAEKKGFSKFGSYTGNGSADGTFVYTGFKPAMVIYKYTSGIEGWMIQDNRRPGYNPMGGNLFPNNTNAESTDARFDFLSNGFKARSANQNTNGGTHIYMAFAEHPLVSSTGTPCTAR